MVIFFPKHCHMMLLTNEAQIVSSNEGKIILTNQRIHMADRDWGNAYSISIFLEDISSVEMRYSSNILFLIMAIVAGCFCAYSFAYLKEDGPSAAGLLATVIFFALYWASRKHLV